MKIDPDIHHRRAIRLKEYDYSQPGAYFVTICTGNRKCLFGGIEDENILLNPVGKKALELWSGIPEHFENIILDQFVVMPNHLHGIITICDGEAQVSTNETNIETKNNINNHHVGVQYIEPKNIDPQRPRLHQFQKTTSGSIGSIIRTYKASVTRWCRQNGHEYFKWQKNFYEHIIRNDKELTAIREYIKYNPIQWESDKENPENER